MQCGAATVPVTRAEWGLPSADPSEAYIGSRWATFPLDIEDVRNDTLTLSLEIWSFTDGDLRSQNGLPSDLNPNACELTVSGLCDEAGAPIPDVTVTFQPAPPTPCTSATLQRTQSLTDALARMVSPALNQSAYTDQLRYALAFTQMGNDALATVAPTPVPALRTRACFVDATHADFASDPCCNHTLAMHVCCAPRTQSVTVARPESNEEAIAAQCRTPRCVHQALALVGDSTIRLCATTPGTSARPTSSPRTCTTH